MYIRMFLNFCIYLSQRSFCQKRGCSWVPKFRWRYWEMSHKRFCTSPTKSPNTVDMLGFQAAKLGNPIGFQGTEVWIDGAPYVRSS